MNTLAPKFRNRLAIRMRISRKALRQAGTDIHGRTARRAKRHGVLLTTLVAKNPMKESASAIEFLVKGRSRLLALAAFIGACGVLLTTAAPAFADAASSVSTSGWVGPYRLNYATCGGSSGFINVTQPMVWAFNATTGVDGQYVDWFADLYRLDKDSGKFVFYTEHAYRAWATDAYPFGAVFNTGNFTFTSFSPPPGDYRVGIGLRWYPSNTITYGGFLFAVLNMAYLPGPDCHIS